MNNQKQSANQTESLPSFEQDNFKTYDEVPYESFPFAASHPNKLRTIGTLFGIKAVPIENASILELGCSMGENIIPLAITYPKSKIVGIDLSEVQINIAKKRSQDLGIKNIEFKAMSITDIDENFGKFDYIICHGVYSWVPQFVQDKILEVSSKNLNDNGIAYISYNTLPGWNNANIAREMMRYHTRNLTETDKKLEQSKALVSFIDECLKDKQDPYSQIIQQELNIINNNPSYYLYHEYLENDNYPKYFYEFIQEASKYGLQYLAESQLSSMYIGGLPGKAQETLSKLSNILLQEQYIDFIINRRFRSTLLCKIDESVNHNLNADLIENYYFKIQLTPQHAFEKSLIENDKPIKFTCNNGAVVTSNSIESKVFLYVMASNQNKFLSFQDIKTLSKELYPTLSLDILTQDIKTYALKWLFLDVMEISIVPDLYDCSISNKPKVSEHVRYQAANNFRFLTNNDHIPIAISNEFERFLISLLDGSNNKESLINHLYNFIHTNSEAVLYIDNQPLSKDTVTKELISNLLDNTLNSYSIGNLLIG